MPDLGLDVKCDPAGVEREDALERARVRGTVGWCGAVPDDPCDPVRRPDVWTSPAAPEWDPVDVAAPLEAPEPVVSSGEGDNGGTVTRVEAAPIAAFPVAAFPVVTFLAVAGPESTTPEGGTAPAPWRPGLGAEIEPETTVDPDGPTASGCRAADESAQPVLISVTTARATAATQSRGLRTVMGRIKDRTGCAKSPKSGDSVVEVSP